jgi:hypothetical protein
MGRRGYGIMRHYPLYPDNLVMIIKCINNKLIKRVNGHSFNY